MDMLFAIICYRNREGEFSLEKEYATEQENFGSTPKVVEMVL